MSVANPRSVAYFGVGYTSLSISWLGNWGDSWGPYPVEEDTQTYYGGRPRRSPGPTYDPLLEAQVRAKWEAIEAAHVREKLVSSTGGASPVQKDAEFIQDVAPNHNEDARALVAAVDLAAPANQQGILTSSPIPSLATLSGADLAERLAQDQARKRRNDAALLLILAEL